MTSTERRDGALYWHAPAVNASWQALDASGTPSQLVLTHERAGARSRVRLYGSLGEVRALLASMLDALPDDGERAP